MENKVIKTDGELLAIISASVHDMKTPLTSISGFADAILDGRAEGDKEKKYLTVIKEEAERLGRICTELLDAAKIRAGEKEYKKEPFDIAETARKVLISLERQIYCKKLDVLFDADPERIIAVGDKDGIERVIYNICHNAVKFSDDGTMLKVFISEQENEIRVRIEDKGKKLEEAELTKVFLPFYQKGESGTGLGMFIAKSIIDAHGGKISAESRDGVTAFSFTIYGDT
ncbi:MAG: HAMP domain-containing sensor histidine kinase [Clostridia bacterium]|nr:HAMP domain-containing sensor histidine kinase [Clostridia bacterium]